MLPTLASGSSKRGRKNHDAALRALSKVTGQPAMSAAADAQPIDPSRFELLPTQDAPKRKRKPYELKLPHELRDNAQLHLPRGATYTQAPRLPPSSVPGRAAVEAMFTSSRPGAKKEDVFVPGVDALFEDHGEGDGPELDVYGPAVQAASRHRRRRLKQHENWSKLVSEALVERYLLYKHGHGEHNTRLQETASCACVRRRLNVTLADWDSTRVIQVFVCACAPACEQLLSRGYFPSAPMSPSMAFSTALLEFISIHSLNVAPNSTAWSDTLETFWSRRGAPARHHGRLRKRLAMALTWFQVLDNRAEVHVSEAVNGFSVTRKRRSDDMEAPQPRKRARTESAAAAAPASEPEDARRGMRSPGTTVQDVPCEEADEAPCTPEAAAGVNDAESEEERSRVERPTQALRQKCPLCFGGVGRPKLQHTDADVIVCLDANFAQKRRKCASADPPVEFIDGRFLSPQEVQTMEAELEKRRQGKPKRRTRGTSARVADEVLDECEQSFIAAQEKVVKASTNYYADTGLMALLCRHDRVLWVANMDTPGERQHFALALLRRLGQELPADWRVGVLYDIACQLSRSIEKWGLLSELADRFTFGVSVFHAYGHQWACQVVFHPRKRAGFGLTDGEGCERFWSAIRHLIAGLRVSGHNRRLLVLDRQIEAMSYEARWNFGVWLRRRYTETVRRLAEATAIVERCGVSEGELGKQWDAQVRAQLKKAPRQSATAADKVIEKILVEMGTVDDLRQEAREVKAALRKAHKISAAETQQLSTRTEAIQRELAAARAEIATMNASLGTEQCRRLEAMRGSAYLQARVNARALRAAIRQALQAHKFERQKLERAYRHQVMHAKDHAQTKNLVHRREKTITAQVRKYNVLVDQMALLARQGKKPTARTRLPRRLDIKKLFRLDVDDEIWQEDPGLGPQDEGDVPRWQTDTDVKRGIVALLEKRRCVEEQERVRAEVRALDDWWKEEESVLRRALLSPSLSDGVGAAVGRRVLAHRTMRDVWVRDLALCGLITPAPAYGAASGGARVAQNAPADARAQAAADDGVNGVPPAQAAPAALTVSATSVEGVPAKVLLAEDDVDSDDASDAYSSGEDEDEPLAEVLDELERAAADLEPDVEEETVDGTNDGNAVALETGEQRTEPAQAKHKVIVVSDSSDEDAPQKPRARAKKLANYRAGAFACDDMDLERVATRTGWLSGEGLAVFLQGQLEARQLVDISIVHPRTLLDVEVYHEGLLEGAEDCEIGRAPVDHALAQLVPPGKARKWLIFGHVASPPHWTLLEIRWDEGKIYFYDSFARVGGYAAKLETTVRQFLRMGEVFLETTLDVDDLIWVGEKRAARQTNSWDCGPFAAADACSLLDGDVPSAKTQKDMAAWRKTMEAEIRSLVYVR